MACSLAVRFVSRFAYCSMPIWSVQSSSRTLPLLLFRRVRALSCERSFRACYEAHGDIVNTQTRCFNAIDGDSTGIIAFPSATDSFQRRCANKKGSAHNLRVSHVESVSYLEGILSCTHEVKSEAVCFSCTSCISCLACRAFLACMADRSSFAVSRRQ